MGANWNPWNRERELDRYRIAEDERVKWEARESRLVRQLEDLEARLEECKVRNAQLSDAHETGGAELDACRIQLAELERGIIQWEESNKALQIQNEGLRNQLTRQAPNRTLQFELPTCTGMSVTPQVSSVTVQPAASTTLLPQSPAFIPELLPVSVASPVLTSLQDCQVYTSSQPQPRYLQLQHFRQYWDPLAYQCQ